jgi:hypothetical protein
MNRERLQEMARREGVRDDCYSLDGGLRSEQYVLAIEDGRWSVYYSERGERRGLASFDTEDAACSDLFERLLVDRTTRERFSN